jgi:hypothetical protein
MRVGLYIFVAVTFIAIMGAFAYTVNPSDYTVEILDIPIKLPVALWSILPAILLLVVTISHMTYYGLKGFFKAQRWKKDANTLDKALYWSVLHEPKQYKFLIKDIAQSARVLGSANIDTFESVSGLSPRLSKALNLVSKIKSGEYVDLYSEKMGNTLSEGNPILIQNRLNRLDSDEKFVEDVVKSPNLFSDAVSTKALEIFANSTNFTKVERFIKSFDTKNFFRLLDRVNSDDDLEINANIIEKFVEELKFNCKDFVHIAKVTKSYIAPDENLAQFKKFQKENPKAQNAYLYLLFEYEMIDEVERYLDEHDINDFIKFRAMLDLKRSNKNYKLDELIDINSIC